MKRITLALISLGLVLLLILSSVYIMMPGESSLIMEEGQEFTGLDPWRFAMVRGPPAKVGDAAYILMVDSEVDEENITYDRIIARLDLSTGSVDNYTLDLGSDLNNDTYVRGLLEGDGGLYAYGWRADPDLDNAVTRIVLWEIDLDSMELGEAWEVPGIVNATGCDLLIENGVLYKMPGYSYELAEDGVNTTMITSPSIMTWDISEHELKDSMNVTDDLCDSTMLPFGDEFFGYWTGLKYLSDSFIYDPSTGLTSTIGSLEDYDNFRASWGEVAANGNAIIFPYLDEYVDYKWQLSDTVLALDRSYEVTTGEQLQPDTYDFGWLMGCADDEGAVVLFNQVLDLNTTLDITAYDLTYEAGSGAFHPLLFAIPFIFMAMGIVVQFRKEKK